MNEFITNSQWNKLVEAANDRITEAPYMLKKMSPTAPSLEELDVKDPQIQALIARDIKRKVAQVEKRLKIHVGTKRKTDIPKTAREFYENKQKYRQINVNVPIASPLADVFPMWEHLTDKQKAIYANDQQLYVDGTMPWDLLTTQQKQTLAAVITYAPNKVADAERLDGKNRASIKLYERYIQKIYKIALEIRDPINMGIPFFSRAYSEHEYFLYKESGMLQLVPAFNRIDMMRNAGLRASSAGYGLSVVNLPQILVVDYEFGLTPIPDDFAEAIGYLTAINVFENVNLLFTQGLMGYSVQGFSAQFGKGMFVDVMDRYQKRADELLYGGAYNGGPVMTAW